MFRKLWIPVLLFIIVIFVFAWALLTPAHAAAEGVDMAQEQLETYGVLMDDSYLYDLDFDHDLVKQIQKALNKYLSKHASGYKKISEDGVFGPGTAQAVKLYQYKKGLTIDGICGPKTLKSLGIDPEGITSYPRWIPNLYESFRKSTTGMALHLNLGSHKLEVYVQDGDEWYLVRVMLAATGNYKKGNFTDLGDLLIGKTRHKYIAGTSNGKKWRGYFALGIQKGDFFHTVLAHYKNGQWVFDDNSALGKDVTHGCVRLARENAEWLYENVKPGTACVVDDRAWDFPVTD